MSLPGDQQRHEVQLQRLITRILNSEVYPTLDASVRRAIRALNEAGELRSATQVNALIREINAPIRESMTAAWGKVTEELEELATYEAGFYAELLQKYGAPALSVPAADRVNSYIARSLISLGDSASPKTGTWSQFIMGNIDAATGQIDNTIRAGFVRGQTVPEVSRGLRTIGDGMLKRNADALARTGLSHYTTRAHEAMARDNADILEKKYLLVTFDNRTTFICMRYGSSDANPWRIDDPQAPVLPLHYNERSTYVYMVKGQDTLSGTRPVVGGKGDKQAREIYERRKERLRTKSKVTYRGRRDSELFDVKQMQAGTPYDKWFARQPAWFQDSTIGPTRGKLYRQGGFELRQFSDMTGRELSLAELRAIDQDAFERAGL